MNIKVDLLEQGQQGFNKKTDKLSVQSTEVEKNRLEKAFELWDDDFKHIEDEAREVHNIVGRT